MNRRDPRPLPLEAFLRRTVALGRSFLDVIDQWARRDEGVAERLPVRPAEPPVQREEQPRAVVVAPRPRVRTPSIHHDTGAEPIRVRMSSSVYRRLLGEYLNHIDSPEGEKETGWVPVGEPEGDELLVTGFLPKGPKARASWGDFEIDKEFVFSGLLLLQTKAPLGVVGLVHSHPERMDWNSSTDLRTDEENCTTVAGGAAIYPILTREPLAALGHVALASSVRTTFWGMRAERPGVYVRCEVTFDERLADATRWLAPFECALEECAPTVFALGAEARVPLAIKPATDEPGAVDLTCALDSERAHVRFAPEAGPISVIGAGRAIRVDCEGADGRALARKILELLRKPKGQAGAKGARQNGRSSSFLSQE